MLVEDLERVLEELAPRAVAEPWDTVGLLVGRRGSAVSQVLVALDLSEDVVVEAATGGYQAIITHHPLLFTPLRRVTDADRRGMVVTQLIAADIAYIALHTNLDGAPGGLCDLAMQELGLVHAWPLQRTNAGLKKFVGFIPPDSVEQVSRAVFDAGAGHIGAYHDCAFESRGEGTFVAEAAAHPSVGRPGRAERAPEVRWEAVVPQSRVVSVVQAYLSAHPYEEPAFDVYPVDDVLSSAGQGRVGATRSATSLVSLAETAAQVFGLREVWYSGDSERRLDRVALVTGSGGSLIESAAGAADVLVTGDLRYHDAERAADLGLSLIAIPHDALESWALRRWTETLSDRLVEAGVRVRFSELGRSPWHAAFPVSSALRVESGEPEVARLFDLAEAGGAGVPLASGGTGPLPREVAEGAEAEFPHGFVLRVDGGSRGNPGPSAIGVVLEDARGVVVEEIGACIGTATNNQAEYQALITGLETALDRGITRLRIMSDSELLVRQLRGEYKVRNDTLKELFLQVRALVREFDRVEIRHVPREENTLADALVNQALDGTL